MDFADIWLWGGETQSAMSECISHSHSRFTAVRLPSVFPSEPNKALSQSFVCEGLGVAVRENHTPDLTGYFIALFGCVKQAVERPDSLLWMIYFESGYKSFSQHTGWSLKVGISARRREDETGLTQRGKFHKVSSSRKQYCAVRGPVRFELYDVRKNWNLHVAQLGKSSKVQSYLDGFSSIQCRQ